MPYDERDDETQQFRPTYTDEEFLEAMDDLVFPATSSVAEEVGCSTDTARYRLDKLVDRGELGKKEVGGQNLYFIPE